MEVMYKGQINSPQTVLSEAIDNIQTEILVEDASILPEPPNILTIGFDFPFAETVKLLSKLDNTITVERAFQGETKKLVFTVIDDSGTVVDLTGAKATWVLATKVDSDDIILMKSSDLGSIVVVGNTFELVLSKSDTVDLLGNYYHEIRMIKVDLSEAVVATGNLIVKKSITK